MDRVRPARVKPSRPPPMEAPVERKGGWVPSGSTLLDRVLGGGWALGRMVNLVGDKSSGKTLLAIEACANFALKYGAENARYVETESAFDELYAESVGLPAGVYDPDVKIDTVQEWEQDLLAFLEPRRSGEPCMYVLDSMDAASEKSEMERKEGAETYGTGKAKFLSEMFRKRIRLIEDRNCLLFIVSQIRDNIGVMFGEKKKRSGGKALDFYASQVVWLAEVAKLRRKIGDKSHVYGMTVKAQTKKNKVGTPFRTADLDVIFSYGVDDETSMIGWLADYKALDTVDTDIAASKLEATLKAMRRDRDREGLAALGKALRIATRAKWAEIEETLAPPMRKYGD